MEELLGLTDPGGTTARRPVSPFPMKSGTSPSPNRGLCSLRSLTIRRRSSSSAPSTISYRTVFALHIWAKTANEAESIGDDIEPEIAMRSRRRRFENELNVAVLLFEEWR